MTMFLSKPFKHEQPEGTEHSLGSFAEFASIVNQQSNLHGVAWRGQASSTWRLTSAAYRAEQSRAKYYPRAKGHQAPDHPNFLAEFVRERTQLASRSVQKALSTNQHFQILFGESLRSIDIAEETETYNEMLSICQHFGMKTPLLDVTYSAYVALYFAAESALRMQESNPGKSELQRFAVWKIPANLWQSPLTWYFEANINAVDLHSRQNQLKSLHDKKLHGPSGGQIYKITITNVVPRIFRTDRLIAQQASFIRVSPEYPLDHLLPLISLSQTETYGQYLTRFTLPVSEALNCLIALSKMNIRPDTLFPDLTGQMEYINIALNHYDYAGITDPLRGSVFTQDSVYYEDPMTRLLQLKDESCIE